MTIKTQKSYRVRIEHPDRAPVEFGCNASTPICVAAVKAGIALETACERGGCGACRATLLDGRVGYPVPVSEKKLRDPTSGRKSLALTCRAVPRSDLRLRPMYAWRLIGVKPMSSLLNPK